MYAFQLLNAYNSLTHYAKGTSFFSDCFTHIISRSFHSIFLYGSFHHSLTVLYTINHWSVFIVRGWFLYFQFLFFTIFVIKSFLYGTVPVSFKFFSITFFFLLYGKLLAFPLLISLAATFNLSVDFLSTYYLEVSVCKVFFNGFPLDISGSLLCYPKVSA